MGNQLFFTILCSSTSSSGVFLIFHGEWTTGTFSGIFCGGAYETEGVGWWMGFLNKNSALQKYSWKYRGIAVITGPLHEETIMIVEMGLSNYLKNAWVFDIIQKDKSACPGKLKTYWLIYRHRHIWASFIQ